MKFSPIAGLLAAALVLAGCEQATTQKDSGSGPETKSLTVVSTSSTTYTYYNLSTGEVVTNPATTDWDVAFSSSTSGIRTNSGQTASDAASGGLGGVYYTGSTTFSSVTNYNADGFGGDYAVDVAKYVATNMATEGESYTAPTSTTTLNIMTKLDYNEGTDGTEANYFKNKGDAAAYDGDAYYAYDAATHLYSFSNEVYIIRHGDGASYSKFQVTSMTGSSSERTRVIKYANF